MRHIAHRNDWIDSRAKRRLDVCIVLLLLPILCPLTILLSVLSMCLDRSWPLFYQMRVGRGGVLFRFYKLNTMGRYRNTDVGRGANDARATALGRWLRRTTFDEVPQIIINVLRGDMALVGPRPLLRADMRLMKRRLGLAAFDRWYRVYSATIPGWTGWFGVESRKLTAPSDEYLRSRLHYDIAYRKRASIRLDMRIICAHATLPYLERRQKQASGSHYQLLQLIAAILASSLLVVIPTDNWYDEAI